MSGISRWTGKPLSNLQSAYQGVEVILTTRLASRLMRREFGGGIVELLGRAVTPVLFVAWQQLVATAIDLWEPRFRVRKIEVDGTAAEIRQGTATLRIAADYRPNAHLATDDPNYSTDVDSTVVFGVSALSGTVSVGALA